jgi:BMFP domain-containing protein YqiC
MKEDVIDKEILDKIDNNIKELTKKRVSRFNIISREEFLDLSYKYLVFNQNNYEVSIKYRDLENKDNLKANAIFDKNNTWKDRFGTNYYRPKVKITR